MSRLIFLRPAKTVRTKRCSGFPPRNQIRILKWRHLLGGRIPLKTRIAGGVAAGVVLILVIVLLFSSGGEEEEPVAIRVPNGSFEEAADGQPVGWTYRASEHLEVSIDEREEGKGQALLMNLKNSAPLALETTVYNEREFTALPKSMLLTARMRRQFPEALPDSASNGANRMCLT